MKRLLAYLFIILGLGLTFNVNAEADIVEACIIEKDYSTTDNPEVKILYSFNLFKKPKININSNYCEYFTDKKKDDKKIIQMLDKSITSNSGSGNYRMAAKKSDRSIGWNYRGTISSRNYNLILNRFGRISKIYKPSYQTQIAKAEPSQTQKVAEKDKIKLILCKDNEKKSRYYPFLKDEWIDGQCPKSTPVKISYDEYKLSKQTICLREKQGNDTPAYLILSKNEVSCDVGIDHTVEIKFDGEDFYLKKNKLTKQLKIAKIDPRQNQKVAKSETTVKLVFKGQYVCLEGHTNCGKYSPSGPISFNKWKSRKSSFNKNGLCMSPEFGTVFYAHTIDNCDHYEKTYSTKYYRLTNLKDNVFKIDGYIGKVAIKKFDDPYGVVSKKIYCTENKIDEKLSNFKEEYIDKEDHYFYSASIGDICIQPFIKTSFKEYQNKIELFRQKEKNIETKLLKQYQAKRKRVTKQKVKFDKDYLKSLPSNRRYHIFENNENFEMLYNDLSDISEETNLDMSSEVWVRKYSDEKGKDHWDNKYPKSGGAKAWAQSADGAWAWRTAGSKLSAAKQALGACSDYMKDKSYGSKKCVVVKVNDKILTYEEQNYYSEKSYGLPTILATIIKENEKIQLAKKETEQKDENLYNWYALAKHPKTNFEFIATKVSNKEDAKKIAIRKCYIFVTNQLNKKGYNDCFIDLIIDKRDNLQLAENIILKQQDQITQIAKVVSGPNKQIKKDDFKCTWKSIDKVINFSINKKKIVDYGGYKYPIIFENNKYIMFVSSNDYGGIKLFNKNTKELSSSWALNKTDAIVDLKTNRSMPIYANCKKIIETQIAKIEEPKQEEFKPKKKIKVAKTQSIQNDFYLVMVSGRDPNYSDVKYKYFFGLDKEKFKATKIAKEQCRKETKKIEFGYCFEGNYFYNGNYYDRYNNLVTNINSLYKYEFEKKIKSLSKETVTEIVKKEPKQEEFKPKKTNQDNEAPVIEIAEAITVDSQAYTLKGKVKDKSQVYLTIDGRQVDVKKGKFKLDRFNIDPDVAENIKIVAIDKWNNRTEKTIKVTIDLQSTDVAKVYEQLKPNNIKVKTDKNKIAIIIGIEKYENLTNLDAKYANRDAKAFRTYATRALGIKPSNIKMLIDDKATRSQALKAFKLWLPKIAGKGGKDIHIFFAGHGLASDNGEDLYILPQDGESSLLEDTAISRVELISLINKVNPKSVTMFFDTCYSGQTRDERMLVASLRPIRIVADEQEKPDNFTIFTASNYDQTSGSIEEAEHGMFSYYLMKGLEGKADGNKDRKITNGELISYLKENVSQEAFTQNRQQDPMLAGDPDKILIKF